MAIGADPEQRFMDQLFEGLDADVFDQPWSSQSSPERKPAAAAAAAAAAKMRRSPTRSPIRPKRPPSIDHRWLPSFRPGQLFDDDDFVEPKPRPTVQRKIEDALGLPLIGHRLADMDLEALRHRERQRRIQRSYTRCLVIGVAEQNYVPDGPSTSRQRHQRVLILREQSGDTSTGRGGPATDDLADVRLALLRDEWLSTDVRPGDFVHLIGRFEAEPVAVPGDSTWSGRLEGESKGGPKVEVATDSTATGDAALDDDDLLWAEMGSLPSLSQPAPSPSPSQPGTTAPALVLSSQAPPRRPDDYDDDDDDDARGNLLIVHPDVLVPATKVSDVSSCVRKPVIQDRLRGGGDLTVPLVMGNMLHEVLQACLTGRGSDTDAREDEKLLDAIERVRRQEEAAAAQRAADGESPQLQPPFGAGQSNAAPPPTVRDWPATWTGIGNFSRPFVLAQIRAQVESNTESLFAIGLDTDQAYARLEAAAAPFGHFAAVYLADHGTQSFRDDAVITDPRSAAPVKTRLTRILDVEEEVWSPMYGLKGKVDVSVEAVVLEEAGERGGSSLVPARRSASDPRHLHTASPFHTGSATGTRTSSHINGVQTTAGQRLSVSVMPLELKTGRSNAVGMEHRAQTMLYTLMLSDRYGCDVRDGLLFYSKSGQMHRIRKSRNEVRALIMGRNELAGYLVRREGQGASAPLPPTIDNAHKCRRCYAVDGCMLLRRAIENVVEPEEGATDAPEAKSAGAAPSPIAALYAQKTSHLTQAHADFFRQWSDLLSLEEQDLVRFRRELWTMTAASREGVGRCFAGMRLVDPDGQRQGKGVRRFLYAFERGPDGTGRSPASLVNGHISVNDPVTISIEPALLSVAQGFVTSLTATRIEIGLDHDLTPALQRSVEEAGLNVPHSSAVFRIDRDELSAGMGKVRSNLAALFWPGEAGDVKRRELIVDLRPPRFLTDDAPEMANLCLPSHLNVDQRAAMQKVLSAEDYALILGMPGTGKTTTIAELIKVLAARGKSVLLTSYTHSAVDTILRKLVDDAGPEGPLRVLRLGNADKVHPDARHLTLPDSVSGVAHLESLLMTPNVVATTCLSISHVLFSKRRFDYCIVDEASQITLPTCLGPLRFADKFVLVGDHFQLPPLVRNQHARRGGLETSLFKLLTERYEREAMVCLGRQYRMNRDVMALSNEVIYNGRLQCGSDEVANQRLELPRRDEVLAELAPLPEWLSRVLDPAHSVLFVNTDALPAHESNAGSLLQNTGEIRLAQLLTTLLVRCGASPRNLAAITPYRHQLKLLSAALHDDIETLTADKAQGRDKDAVLLSLVRSNSFGTVGELLRDWRRLNVALTRSRMKLVVLGSWKTLRASEEVRRFLDVFERRAWRVDVQSWDEVERVEARVLAASSAVKSKGESEGPSSVVKCEEAGAPLIKSEELVLPKIKAENEDAPMMKEEEVGIVAATATKAEDEAMPMAPSPSPSPAPVPPPLDSAADESKMHEAIYTSTSTPPPAPAAPARTSAAATAAATTAIIATPSPAARDPTAQQQPIWTPTPTRRAQSPTPPPSPDYIDLCASPPKSPHRQTPSKAGFTKSSPSLSQSQTRPPSQSQSQSHSQSKLTSFFTSTGGGGGGGGGGSSSGSPTATKGGRKKANDTDGGGGGARKRTRLSEKVLERRGAGVLRDLVNEFGA